jgi:hypothetical protein
MEPAIEARLDELTTTGRAHDAREPAHRNRLLNLEAETARLVAILLRPAGGGRCWRSARRTDTARSGWPTPDQLALLLPKLAPDALLLADNVLSHPEEIAGYLAAIERLPGFDRIVVPVGKGLSIAHRASA